jgi:hypothetical protein
LVSSEGDEFKAPVDWLTDSEIKLGTAHHNILTVCNEFTTNADWLFTRDTLVNDKIHPLNQTVTQFEKIVSDTITVAGKDANGGGRSGVFNFDGFVSMNFGANTIDRQSLWIDTAGGVVSRIGRDRQNISYASTLDGDVFIEVGGSGIGNSQDGRFSTANDSFRAGTFDIRVRNDSGLSAIVRIDPTGIHLISPGRLTLWAEQDLILKSVRGDIKMEAENIITYSETAKKRIGRNPANQEIR